MIPRLASPSVCVIDDEESDYRPILNALLRLGIGCVHVKGDSYDNLPPQPFKGLRLIFTDLHLGTFVGKDAASHTANVFKTVVSPETAPVVVVIWSKYANDVPENNPDIPPDDQPTEADLFKQTLLNAVPQFQERLVFLQMPKPKDRPASEAWVEELQTHIQQALQGQDAFDVLWSWEALVREAGIRVSEGLTSLAQSYKDNQVSSVPLLQDNLKLIFRLLAQEQGGSDCSDATAPRHLASVLAQSFIDQLEHADGVNELSHHGSWLSDRTGVPRETPLALGINGFLLTARPAKGTLPFMPGTVYRATERENFKQLFGVSAGEMINLCYTKLESGSGWNREKWKKNAIPVFLEISPACDVAQGNRRSALLLAGIILPAAARSNAKSGAAFEILPTFSLRWPVEEFKEDAAFLMFCSRYKVTLASTKEPEWLIPWFRLRELPTASLRNWHAGHAARVGYVSLKASI